MWLPASAGRARITVGRHGGSPYAVTKRSRSQETDKPFNTVPTDDRHTGCLSRRGEPPVVRSGFSADRRNIMENSNRTPGLSVRLRSVALGVALIATAAVVQVRVAAQDLTQLVSTATPAQAAPLIYNNRQITVFRAAVLSRTPAERAQAASDRLDRIVNDGAARDGLVAPSAGRQHPLRRQPRRLRHPPARRRHARGRDPGDHERGGHRAPPTSGRRSDRAQDAAANRHQHRVGAAGDGHRRDPGPGDAALSPQPGCTGVQDRRTEAQAVVGGRRARQGLAGARGRAEGCHDDFHRLVAVHRLQLADLRPAAVPLHASMGRIPAIVPSRSARLLRHERSSTPFPTCSRFC